MPATSKLASTEWDHHRAEITKMYCHDGKTLPQVRKIMKDKYGFDETERAYKRRFTAWSLEKNVKEEVSKAMLGIAKRRMHKENKLTAFKHYSKRIKQSDHRRSLRRYKKKDPNFSPDMGAATPPNITYGTPEPDVPNDYSLPPPVLGYPDQETSEGGQASMGDSPGSYCLTGDPSPQASTVPWEASPNSFTGLPYPGTEEPIQNTMLSQDTFSGHQQSYAPLDFSQANPSSALNPQTWGGPTQPPSHPYHAPAYGTPWASHPQPLQQGMHSLSLDSTALAFPNHCGAGVGYGLIDNTRFDNAIPSQNSMEIPDTGSNDLEYMPLHSAVASNDINSAGALLRNGVSPNDEARGGVTPLHCAASQKNVDMIKLLLSYGASLDATTDEGQSVLFFAVCGPGELGSSDVSIHGTSTLTGSGPHTDDSTSRTIDALFECPTRWEHLRSSLDKPDKDGVTPLMVAAGEGFLGVARKLLQSRAQPHLRDHANRTALKYAAMNNHRDIVRLLLLSDPAISHKRDISHILKLASENIAAGHIHGGGRQRRLRGRRHDPGEMLISEEIVRLCRVMDALDRLLTLAKQKRKSGVVECLQRALTQLDSEGSHTAGA